jgi:hypothetical protein
MSRELSGPNDKERKVFEVLRKSQKLTIEEIGGKAWPNKSHAKATSWTRNSLRRLVFNGFVGQAGVGTYRITAKGKSAKLDAMRLKPLPRKEPKGKKAVKKVQAAAKKKAVKKTPKKKVAKKPAKPKKAPAVKATKATKTKTTSKKESVVTKLAKDKIKADVKIGSIWRDCDPRRNRQVKVENVLSDSVVCKSTTGGPSVKISIDRFHFNASAKKGFCPIDIADDITSPPPAPIDVEPPSPTNGHTFA